MKKSLLALIIAAALAVFMGCEPPDPTENCEHTFTDYLVCTKCGFFKGMNLGTGIQVDQLTVGSHVSLRYTPEESGSYTLNLSPQGVYSGCVWNGWSDIADSLKFCDASGAVIDLNATVTASKLKPAQDLEKTNDYYLYFDYKKKPEFTEITDEEMAKTTTLEAMNSSYYFFIQMRK